MQRFVPRKRLRHITVPEALAVQKSELESALQEIARAEDKLAAQRKEIQSALTTITTGIEVLSGQRSLPTNKVVTGTARRPMSESAKRNIAEGLRKAREAKAKAAQLVVSAPETPAPAPVDHVMRNRPTTEIFPYSMSGACGRRLSL